MYRRVAAPVLLAVGVSVGIALVAAGSDVLTRMAMDNLLAGRRTWMPPVVPLSGWLLFLAVFLAVRMCVLRGGSRRECLAVGLSPLVLGSVFYGFLLMTYGGLSALELAVGSTTAVMQGRIGMGTALAARAYAWHLLNLAGTCIAATWLCLSAGHIRPESATKAPLSP